MAPWRKKKVVVEKILDVKDMAEKKIPQLENMYARTAEAAEKMSDAIRLMKEAKELL